MSAIVLMLFAGMPADYIARDTVDVIELNHFYYANSGRPGYDQIIFYDWCPRLSEYRVRACRPLQSQGQYPTRDFPRGDWVAVFFEDTLLREVRAISFRETWTQYDVDQAECDKLPKAKRRGLLWEKRTPSCEE